MGILGLIGSDDSSIIFFVWGGVGSVLDGAEDGYKTQRVSPNLIPESRKTSKITSWDFCNSRWKV